jgi:hypothetical protein
MVGVMVIGLAMMAPGTRAEEMAQAVPATPAATPAPSEAAQPAVAPSAEQAEQAVRSYIAMVQEDEGSFTLDDEATGSTRTLTLESVQPQVSEVEENLFRVCVNMRDTANNDTLDIDFDLDSYDGELEVFDAQIHKVNGQVRVPPVAQPSESQAPVTP